MKIKSSWKNNYKKSIKKIKNQETFAYGTHIEDIPAHRLLILDEYAFDVEELNALPEQNFFINMHTQKEFSEGAKKNLLSHELLKEKAAIHSSKKQGFPQTLLKSIYYLGIALLQNCDEKENNEALRNFSRELANVYPDIKNEFLNYTVKMSRYNYRVKAAITSSMQVRKLLTELSEGKIEMHTGGNWLIQLVRSQKPDMVNEVYILKLKQEFSQTASLDPIQTIPRTPAFFVS
ncbi:hypothetical protein OQJ18_03225 [Fluoribacter dumoffii]|uniref:Uncharacterized protein n=1 Tax=Fluoribacter dumoffii TaxID=463 RepID=A0A377GA28_9GAMM|nr:hypothetical protein [Fluoribacter dumoffii]KTC88934.1 hypothetical protein Ldum_3192 [Fluoribacter dumoffii NY 23]MCW8385854.1 hypothetical protein [Fluoribacter dumoffii]MCW8418907.1 hypothetical protein [Fluoribacter dumoffii]MCW8453249.1 hypothetical protein [Fluoribacter dumoffii]MCW8459530.1 hypothetical protein [Fluoribacter dumoffii]